MIAANEIRAAISDLLKNKAGFPHEVHFDNVHEASKSYFYVEISERRKTFDPVYYERSLSVDIQLVLLPDQYNRIRRADLYEAEDTLNRTLRPILQIGDRSITVLDTKSHIHDGILHYEFELHFVDSLPTPEYDIAEELSLNFSAKRPNDD